MADVGRDGVQSQIFFDLKKMMRYKMFRPYVCCMTALLPAWHLTSWAAFLFHTIFSLSFTPLDAGCALPSTSSSCHALVLHELFPLLCLLFMQILVSCSVSSLSWNIFSTVISKVALPSITPSLLLHFIFLIGNSLKVFTVYHLC